MLPRDGDTRSCQAQVAGCGRLLDMFVSVSSDTLTLTFTNLDRLKSNCAMPHNSASVHLDNFIRKDDLKYIRHPYAV